MIVKKDIYTDDFVYYEPGKSFGKSVCRFPGNCRSLRLTPKFTNFRRRVVTIDIWLLQSAFLQLGWSLFPVASDVNQHTSNFVQCEPCLSLYAIADRFGSGQGGVANL